MNDFTETIRFDCNGIILASCRICSRQHIATFEAAAGRSITVCPCGAVLHWEGMGPGLERFMEVDRSRQDAAAAEIARNIDRAIIEYLETND